VTKEESANTELEFWKTLWGAMNRGGIGLSYRPSRGYIGWRNTFLANRFLGSINVYKNGLQLEFLNVSEEE
jgi:hypothetical protein